MKKILVCFLFVPLFSVSQTMSPSVLGCSGDSYSNNTIIIDFTIGEIVIETLQPATTPLPLFYNIFTQGFHQEILKISPTTINNYTSISKVYPNPTTSIVNVELEKNISADVLVYDVNGKLIISDFIYNSNFKSIDFSLLNQGNYFLHILSNYNKTIYQINKTR